MSQLKLRHLNLGSHSRTEACLRQFLDGSETPEIASFGSQERARPLSDKHRLTTRTTNEEPIRDESFIYALTVINP